LLARVWLLLGRYGWLLTGLVCLILGYMLVWQRGLYVDDYTHKSRVSELLSGGWNSIWGIVEFPSPRPLGLAVDRVFAALLPAHEFPVRAAAAFLVGVNALLLGSLVYRVLRSRLAAVVAGWLFLMPVYAQEALLWASSVAYVFAGGLTLLFLHATWLMLARREPKRFPMLLAAASFGAALLFSEAFVCGLGLVPALALTAAFQRQRGERLDLGRQCVYALVCPLASAGLIYLALYRRSQSTLITGRGGLDPALLGIIQRSVDWVQRLVWMTAPSSWGQGVVSDALGIGVSVLASSWIAAVLAGAAAVLLVLTVLSWQEAPGEYGPPYRVGLLMLLAGAAVFVATLLFPGVLVRGQMLEYRLLYFPSAAASIAAGTLFWMLAKRVPRPVAGRVLLAAAGGLMILTTVTVLGFARSYAARYELDQRQVSAIVRALPAGNLPQDAVIVPFDNDEQLFPGRDYISRLLVGVFETPWSASAVLQAAYSRADFRVITANRWTGMHFGYEEGSDHLSGRLTIQGQVVPIDRTVLVTYRAGSAFPVESLTVQAADGSQHTVRFPIAIALRMLGVPTVEGVPVRSR